MLKRLFDLFVALVGLLVLSPLIGLVALVLRAKYGSPVLFKQERVGQYGNSFTLLKFRTMAVSPGPNVTIAGDNRIHRAGAFLRRTKIDELPQLINVLTGHMSLVGPRPEVRDYVDLWPASAKRAILSIQPGITDPASIRYRREEELLGSQDDPEQYYVNEVLPRKVELYLEYVRTRTLPGDIAILIKTLREVIAA